MVEKSCSRSHGQPLPGVRNCAMISSRPEISREGVMAHRSFEGSALYAARRTPGPAWRERYPQTCGVTARSWPVRNADGQAVLVSGREKTQMHNTTLTTI